MSPYSCLLLVKNPTVYERLLIASSIFVTPSGTKLMRRTRLSTSSRSPISLIPRSLLNGRRWVIRGEDGHQNVFEGQGIVGKEPTLAPGESFSYNSHHAAQGNCSADGSFHGIDSAGDPIHVRIPPFEMRVPPESPHGQTEIDLK